jgi:peptidoglycan/LPS O-acetylase OafA/YrhL
MNDRIEGLEGMRGIAAFLVYTHHFFLIFYPAFYFGQHTWVNHFLNPDLAVSWFFVHSGFVLSYKNRNSSKDILWKNLLDQSLRRYLRLLFPVLLSILLTYFMMSLDLQFNIQYGKLVNSIWLQKYLNFQPNLWEAIKQSFYGVYFHFKSSTTYNPKLSGTQTEDFSIN